jgi:hypothetical protein
MSPILKRDVSEQLRQAKRLAAAVTGHPQTRDDQYDRVSSIHHDRQGDEDVYATGSSRRGIGIGFGDEEDTGPPIRVRDSWDGKTYPVAVGVLGKGKERARAVDDERVGMLNGHAHVEVEDVEAEEVGHVSRTRSRALREWFGDEVGTMTPGRWIDLRNLMLEVSPHLYASSFRAITGLLYHDTLEFMLQLRAIFS